MCEQTPVRQLVSDLVAAEGAGFDFSVMSDHYFPWIEEQGHSGYAWSVLGAAAQATSRLPLMTFVTCPTFRYHPAVVAQKAATMGILSGGRFTLGLGAGERLNEHVIGGRLAIGTDPPSAAGRGGRDHPGPVLGRLCQLQRPVFRGGSCPAVRPARRPGTDRHRRLRARIDPGRGQPRRRYDRDRAGR